MLKHQQPLYQVTPITSIRDMMEKAVAEVGDKTAFCYRQNKQEHSATYREFWEQTKFFGTGLAKLGFSKSHFAILRDNRYAWV